MKRALPAMFSKVDTLARLVVHSLPTPQLPEDQPAAGFVLIFAGPAVGWSFVAALQVEGPPVVVGDERIDQ